MEQTRNTIAVVFNQLDDAIALLPAGIYAAPCPILSGASIGAHVRHTVELFQEMIAGYQAGVVNYDKRKRDYTIENDPALAQKCLREIVLAINKENRSLILQTDIESNNNNFTLIESNYHRELLYNLEHTIHHMALIRIGIENLTNIKLPDSFGVAPSTIRYKTACAQ